MFSDGIADLGQSCLGRYLMQHDGQITAYIVGGGNRERPHLKRPEHFFNFPNRAKRPLPFP